MAMNLTEAWVELDAARQRLDECPADAPDNVVLTARAGYATAALLYCHLLVGAGQPPAPELEAEARGFLRERLGR